MSQVLSKEGEELLESIRRILLEVEDLRKSNKELVSTVDNLKARLQSSAQQTSKSQVECQPPEDLGSYTPLTTLPQSEMMTSTNSLKKFVKSSCGQWTDAANLMALPSEAEWKEPYTHFSYIQNAHVLKQSGKIAPANSGKFQKTRELIALVEGRWCYMGTFELITRTNLSVSEFGALSTSAKERLILQSAAAKVTRQKYDVFSMYTSGNLVAAQVDMQRVGFNPKMCQNLMLAAETLSAGAKTAGENASDASGGGEGD